MIVLHSPCSAPAPIEHGVESPQPGGTLECGGGPDAPTDRHTVQAGTLAALDDTQLVALIERIVGHDERALEAFFDATFSRVHGLVKRIVRRAELADEVVDDTYFQVWRQAPRYDAARGRALAWLLCIARSRALATLRHEIRFDHESLNAEDSDIDLPDDTQAIDQWLDMTRGHRLLHEAFESLGANARQLLALAFFRGLSHEQIAEQAALPLGTVKSQIRRALITLRKLLGDDVIGTIPP